MFCSVGLLDRVFRPQRDVRRERRGAEQPDPPDTDRHDLCCHAPCICRPFVPVQSSPSTPVSYPNTSSSPHRPPVRIRPSTPVSYPRYVLQSAHSRPLRIRPPVRTQPVRTQPVRTQPSSICRRPPILRMSSRVVPGTTFFLLFRAATHFFFEPSPRLRVRQTRPRRRRLSYVSDSLSMLSLLSRTFSALTALTGFLAPVLGQLHDTAVYDVAYDG